MGYAIIGSFEGESRVKTVQGIDLTFALFFDGTGNNKHNTDERLKGSTVYNKNTDHKNSSYENDYSNVARLWKCYNANNYNFRQYVEGIGTVNFNEDEDTSTATGSGEAGIADKVRMGCKQIADQLKILLISQSTKNVNTLTVDVFGFSRGSAAARHFIYEIKRTAYKATIHTNTNGGGYGYSTSTTYNTYTDDMGNDTAFVEFPQGGYLAAYCKNYNIQINNIIIRFVGLFDCVVSYNHRLFVPDNGDDTTEEYKTNPKKLGLNYISLAKKVVHYNAMDEHRGSFPLTTIDSAGAKGVTIPFPGVHSDVGGCYNNNMVESKVLIFRSYSKQIAEDQVKMLIAENWFHENQIIIIEKKQEHFSIYNILAGNRTILNTYSFVPLHLMCMQALEFTQLDTPSNAIHFNQTIVETQYSIANDALLMAIKNRIIQQIYHGAPPLGFQYYKDILDKYRIKMNTPSVDRPKGCQKEIEDQEALRKLRNKYLHWNANYQPIYIAHVTAIHPMFPRLEKGDRKRFIIPG